MKPINRVIVASVIAIAISGVSARAYEEGPVTGGGTIEGKVIFNGEVETRKIIPNKDLDVCDGPPRSPLIEVGPDKGSRRGRILVGVAKEGLAGRSTAGQDARASSITTAALSPTFRRSVRVRWLSSTTIRCCTNTHGYYGKRTAFNMALPNKDSEFPRS